ncbi:MAG: hypothetical protein GY839_00580 [candidate division Zixibacteria bacterium]|nr:hypothetical protein [candidate division Zixibacteria bacterium]
MRVILPRILCLILLILGSLTSFGSVINIPDDHVTIQAGINASSDGDTVLVQPGTYVENINFNGHNIVLGSLFMTTGDTSYIETTVIDGDSSGSVTTFDSGEDSTCVLTGFTIRNGADQYGGGVLCHNSDPIIRENRINHNSAMFGGGGIECTQSASIIVNNRITQNYLSYGSGAGVSVSASSDAKIINNMISNNYASQAGGAIYTIGEGTTLIEGNRIFSNYAGIDGGGIYSEWCSPIITGNVIIGNESEDYGGGIYCNWGIASIRHNLIKGNSANNRWGGGIFICRYGAIDCRNNTIIDNFAGEEGGGIYSCAHQPIYVKNAILRNNYAPTGPQYYGASTIIHSNIQGGFPGEGNIDCDPWFCFPDDDNYYLADSSCCVGTGCDSLGNPDPTVDIGALGIGCFTGPVCDYVPGDANGDGSVIGSDVTFGVNYFRGAGPHPPDICWNDSTGQWAFSAADVNGDCRVIGSDITYYVNYFRGLQPEILWCPQTPPIEQ